MGVLGKDLLDFHRPRTNTKVEFGASGYWVESHPTMQPYGAVLTEILNLDAAPLQELLDQYRKAVAMYQKPLYGAQKLEVFDPWRMVNGSLVARSSGSSGAGLAGPTM